VWPLANYPVVEELEEDPEVRGCIIRNLIESSPASKMGAIQSNCKSGSEYLIGVFKIKNMAQL
jgi:hypothetical protein